MPRRRSNFQFTSHPSPSPSMVSFRYPSPPVLHLSRTPSPMTIASPSTHAPVNYAPTQNEVSSPIPSQAPSPATSRVPSPAPSWALNRSPSPTSVRVPSSFEYPGSPPLDPSAPPSPSRLSFHSLSPVRPPSAHSGYFTEPDPSPPPSPPRSLSLFAPSRPGSPFIRSPSPIRHSKTAASFNWQPNRDLAPTPPPRINTPGQSPLNLSQLYCFDDGNVTFQVEDTLYRVHKYFFMRESPEIFGSKFEVVSEAPRFAELHNPDDRPVPLDVSCLEFEALLEFMYSAVFTGEELGLEAWTSILHLSNMWRFDRVKSQAIRHIDAIETMSPVDKIILGEKDKVEQWFLPALINLVERENPISVQEARKLISLGERPVGPVLGMDIPSLLAQGRERFRRGCHWPTASQLVEELFGYT